MTDVLCPCCSTTLPSGHPGRVGILINRKAALGARLTELEWQRVLPKTGPHLRELLVAQIERTKAQLAAVTEQLDAETKETRT